MPTVKVGDINMYYEIHGKGEPLVLIHGLGVDCNGWMLQTPTLSQKYRVVILDNRGVGRTDAPDSVYSIAMMADDTAALIDTLGIYKSHILGFSMGGYIAQELALKYPQRVESLILAATAAKESPKCRQIIYVWLRIVKEDVSLETRFRELFLWCFTDKFFENDEQVTALVNMCLSKRHQQPPRGFAGQVAACLEASTLNRIGQIAVPTLVLVGKEDLLSPVKLSEELSAGIPNAELTVLEAGGHGFCWEIPERFNQAVLDFLDKVGKGDKIK